jgi:hypothetical protein
MLEKLDPGMKRRRLLTELDGQEPAHGAHESTRIMGLREQLYSTYRQAMNQDHWIGMRLAERESLNDHEKEAFDKEQGSATYSQSMLWLQTEYLEGLIREIEDDLQVLAKAGNKSKAPEATLAKVTGADGVTP